MKLTGFIFRLFIIYLATLLFSSCGGGSTGNSGAGIDSNSELALYQQSLLSYKNKNYTDAIVLFNNQLKAYPSGSYSSNAYYFEGRSLYATKDYTSALSQFQIVLTQFNTSSFVNSAQYWLAKSHHKLGQFDIARIEYSKVVATSQWADNAAFQLGKTHYDQALSSANSTVVYTELNFAIPLLQAMVVNPIYAASTSLDDAQYYLGRSLQEQGNLLLTDGTLSKTIPIETVIGQFDLARIEFNKVDASSSLLDDAHYQRIRMDYELAQVANTAIESYALFNTTIIGFQTFINNNYVNSNRLNDVHYYLGRSFQAQGNLLLKDAALATLTADERLLAARTEYTFITVDSVHYDDALYFIGRSYHVAGDYLAARPAYQLIINLADTRLADDAQYQLAKTYYDEAVTSIVLQTAFDLFNKSIDEFVPFESQFSNSKWRDNAFYYKGRCSQRQALLTQLGATPLASQTIDSLFTDARLAFQILLDTDPNSTWADNALFRQGDTFYDQAAFAFIIGDVPNDEAGQTALSQAIEKWTSLLKNPNYQNSNTADNAQYSLGRAYQLVLPITNRYAVPGINGIDFTIVNSANAIAEYTSLINNFNSSSWIDNAHYNIGVTYTLDSLNLTGAAQVTVLDKALNSFNTVVSTFASQSLADNAAEKIALIYHAAIGQGDAYCIAEQNWFNYLVTITKDSTFKTNANTHVADILLGAAGTHACSISPTLTLKVLPIPVNAPVLVKIQIIEF